MTAEHQYAFVVYRVNPRYLDGFQKKMADHEELSQREQREALEILRREAEQSGDDFDEAEALRSIDETEALRTTPWDLLIKIKEVFVEQEHAVEEVRRLNSIARGGDRYFWQGAKFYPEGRKAQNRAKTDDAA